MTPRKQVEESGGKEARQAQLVGERLTELSRIIPLPHEKIQELYPQMRDIRLAYERLTTEADRAMTRV